MISADAIYAMVESQHLWQTQVVVAFVEEVWHRVPSSNVVDVDKGVEIRRYYLATKWQPIGKTQKQPS